MDLIPKCVIHRVLCMVKYVYINKRVKNVFTQGQKYMISGYICGHVCKKLITANAFFILKYEPINQLLEIKVL